MDRAPDSKSGGWGFESLLVCFFSPAIYEWSRKFERNGRYEKNNRISEGSPLRVKEGILADSQRDYQRNNVGYCAFYCGRLIFGAS